MDGRRTTRKLTNGQRARVWPDDDHDERSNKVYVSGLPLSYAAGSPELEEIFKRYGTIVQSYTGRLYTGYARDRPVAYAIIEFEEEASVQLAISGTQGLKIEGHELEIRPFIPRLARRGCNIYFKDFRRSDASPESYLKNLFLQCGNVRSFKLAPQGFGFALYDSPSQAMYAIETLNNWKLPSGARLYVARHKVKQSGQDKTNANMENKPAASRLFQQVTESEEGSAKSNCQVSSSCASVAEHADGDPGQNQSETNVQLKSLATELNVDKRTGTEPKGVQPPALCDKKDNMVIVESQDSHDGAGNRNLPSEAVKVKKNYSAKQSDNDNEMSQAWISRNCKPCPSCGVNIENDGDCNNVHCPSCSKDFCWVCCAILNNLKPYSHFSLLPTKSDYCQLLQIKGEIGVDEMAEVEE